MTDNLPSPRVLTGEVLPPDHRSAPAVDHELPPEAAALIEAGVSANTRRAYASDLAAYHRWCLLTGRTPVPATAATFAAYVTFLAEGGAIPDPAKGRPRPGPAAPRSIERALTAIRTAHHAAGYPVPRSTATMTALRGYRRQRAKAGERDHQAVALTVAQLRALVDACNPESLIGVRDRALVVTGYAMMARRSELVGLNIEDVRFVEDRGVEILIRFSKTDQDAVGDVVALSYGSHAETCPVRLLRAWTGQLAALGITTGPLFRPIDRHGRLAGDPRFSGRLPADLRMSGSGVGKILIRVARVAGVDTAALSAHSLRAGGATSSYEAGNDVLAITRAGRWKDGSREVLGYIRDIDKWKQNAMKGVL